jgi:CubicO group peptidase (beta-lactamase class C family)
MALIGQAPALRADSVTQIAADLGTFVPQVLRDTRTPGMSVALIRSGRLAWAGGFGVTDVVTRSRVDSATIFSAASLAKPVSAYAALQLVDAGLLALDTSLARYVASPFSTEPEIDRITARHVLTHTAGLSNYLQDRVRRVRSSPGEQFSYSGLGFVYLQSAVQDLTKQRFNDLVRETVLQPLGMTHSYLGDDAVAGAQHARGHAPFRSVIAPFGILFLPALLIAMVVSGSVQRVVSGRWRPHAYTTLIAVGSAILFAEWFLWSRSRSLIMCAFFAIVFLFPLVIWIGWTTFGWRMLRKQRPLLRVPALIIWSGAALIAPGVGLKNARVPLPDWFPDAGNAASSLRASAPDLARFAIELAWPTRLSPGLARELQREQIRAGENIGWGLGVALLHSSHGDALWHWGSNPGSRTFFAIYPESGNGVVVLANSGEAGEAVYAVAARALGGAQYWRRW